MPAEVPTGTNRDGKPAVKIRTIHDVEEKVTRTVEENITRIDHGTRYANPAVEAAEQKRHQSLGTTGGQDMSGGSAHGGHDEGGFVMKALPWIGIACVILLLVNAVANRFEGKPLFSGFTSDTPTQHGANQPAGQGTKWTPTVDCGKRGGTRTINPNTGKPSCFVPD